MRTTNQCFPADRFDKPIYYLRDHLGTDLGASNYGRISALTGCPDGALVGHRRERILAEVILVLQCTHGDVLHYICRVSKNKNQYGGVASMCELRSRNRTAEQHSDAPIEYSDIRSSTSRWTVKMNCTTRYRNSSISDKLKKNCK